MGARLEFELFPSRFSQDRVASGNTVFDIEIRRFVDVPYDLVTSVTLGYTTGQCRHRGDVPAISFLLKDDRIAHRIWPLILMIPANTVGESKTTAIESRSPFVI